MVRIPREIWPLTLRPHSPPPRRRLHPVASAIATVGMTARPSIASACPSMLRAVKWRMKSISRMSFTRSSKGRLSGQCTGHSFRK